MYVGTRRMDCAGRRGIEKAEQGMVRMDCAVREIGKAEHGMGMTAYPLLP
jgi:hypothetical protein